MSHEYRIKVDIPVVPIEGDRIVDQQNAHISSVGAEFARVRVGQERFAVLAKDGTSYEVEVMGERRITEGNTWRVIRAISAAEFEKLGRSRTISLR